jgi:hypothetical protein
MHRGTELGHFANRPVWHITDSDCKSPSKDSSSGQVQGKEMQIIGITGE